MARGLRRPWQGKDRHPLVGRSAHRQRLERFGHVGTGVPVPYFDRTAPLFHLRGRTSSELVINSVQYGTRTGNLYPVAIRLTTALPDYVVPGFALGARNVRGEYTDWASHPHLKVIRYDAEALTGGVIVETITRPPVVHDDHPLPAPAGPRLADRHLHRRGSFVRLMSASRIVVPSACLGINTSMNGSTQLWTGGDHEGYFNVIAGGQLELTSIGMSWLGAVGPAMAQDIIFARDTGSRFSTVTRQNLCDELLGGVRRSGPTRHGSVVVFRNRFRRIALPASFLHATVRPK